MISVWGKFYPGTKNFEAMRAHGFLYQRNLAEGLRDWVGDGGIPYTFYDAFNPGAAQAVLVADGRGRCFASTSTPGGSTRPSRTCSRTPTLEGQRTHMNPTALGSGARMLNAYSLVNSRTVYEGQRAAAPDQRVFILTRSAFAGQQRYGAAVWSGDITSTWTAMRAQIPAGLGMSLSGVPYWTMDIGGFSVPAAIRGRAPKAEDAEEWRELNTRWFQFGTFVPLLRVHGETPKREMWEFGGDAEPGLQGAAEVRSAPLPPAAVPLLAGGRRHARGRDDHAAAGDGLPRRHQSPRRQRRIHVRAGVPGQSRHARTRRAAGRSICRAAAAWYDFWTGAQRRRRTRPSTSPPRTIRMPVHVRAGAIVPTGPEIQYTDEKPADPIVLWVYAGADGAFTLYEDDGLTYGYEKGAFARIPIHWNDATRTLTIGKRAGVVPGHAEGRPDHSTWWWSRRQAGRFLVHAQAGQDRPLRRCGRRREVVTPGPSQRSRLLFEYYPDGRSGR